MLSPDTLCSLSEFKVFWGIKVTDTAKDSLLEALINAASARIKKACGHALRRRTVTEDQSGRAGQTQLILREWPIVSIASVYDDTDRAFGSDTLIAPAYYTHEPEAGILLLDGEAFGTGIRNVRVTYVAGYAEFTITGGYNYALDFEETDGVELTAYLSAGDYTPDTLAAELQTQLNLAGASTYTVTFDMNTQKYTIISNVSGGGGVFKILWDTGTHASESCAAVLGFDTTADDSGTASYTGDLAAGQVPEDLRLACKMLAGYYYRMSPVSGAGSIGIMQEALAGGQGTLTYEKGAMPEVVRALIQPYRGLALGV